MIVPAAGEAVALQRRLAGPVDRLALFAALTDGGARPDTALIERTEGPSLLMDRAALRVECRGGGATLIALSAGGLAVIDHVAARLAGHVAAQKADRLELAFDRSRDHDAEARLLAPSPFDALRALLALVSRSPEEPFAVALPGIVAFDHVDLFEDLPANAADPVGFPDFVFWLAESLVLFEPGAPPRLLCTAFGSADRAAAERAVNDAAARLAALVQRCAAAPSLPDPPAPAAPNAAAVDLDDAAYRDVVAAMKARIAAGDIYQIVPSRTFSAPCRDPLAVFAALRRLDPSPYQFYLRTPDHLLLGASPETSVRIDRREGMPVVEVKPIAGTRPRGATPDADDRLEADMRLDAKEAAEHMMLVDLARNDVARVSVPGTRRLERLMSVERYARVMHLVSSVTGRLRPDRDALHALAACLNVGTLTGAPKIRATALLRGAEATRRGPYGGAVGWLAGDGTLDTGVVIRSALVRDGTAFVRAGAGVVHDSDPQGEADETRRKASALLSVLAGAAR